MATTNKYEKCSFKSFLDKYHVIIPMVQRDYAQGRTTNDVNRVRSRFLDAIKGYLTGPSSPNEVMKLDFVYGEKDEVWSKTQPGKLDSIIVTPLDGQQRLTTLYLLHWFAAKKEAVDSSEYEFLKNFSYDIRPSSRDFCAHLLDFIPSFDNSIKKQLENENWFMGDWSNDPTITSMLVMLDAIKEKFSDINDLWHLLTDEERIVFYFLPLSENGLSDELYIKMNSRGKKLTSFEHFKAEYEDLYERDSEKSREINHKFDVEWADTLFPYRDNDGIVDKEFMRYFLYISHILCYEQSEEKSDDEFELIKRLYKDSPKAIENRQYLERTIDCWHTVIREYQSIDNFFKKYLTCSQYEMGKVATYKTVDAYRDSQNFFHACIKLYQVNNNYSYSDFLFLYGIITYLINKDKISEDCFVERLRILRNLIWNSNSGEIRGDSDFMRDLLDEVSELMINGTIKKDLKHGFNGFQEDEEIEKLKRRKDMSPAELERMSSFEDHPLIYGYVSGLGFDYLYLTEAFYSVFNQPHLLDVHRAMISIGDYLQNDSSRYFMGNSNRSTWSQLLHKSRVRNGFEENTMTILKKLLERVHSGETVEDVIEAYIVFQEKEQKYPWRYYFAKYPEMLRGADGELTWDESNDYVCTTLNKHQFNGKHWNPYLNVIHQRLAEKLKGKYNENILSLDNYGGNINILHPIASVGPTGDGYVFYFQNNHNDWVIKQDSSGIDEEDRIQFAINKIEKIVKEYYSKGENDIDVQSN